MIQVETDRECCVIVASQPGVRATLTISHAEAGRLMEDLAYHYGRGPAPVERGTDPLQEALEAVRPKKHGLIWRFFHVFGED